VDSLDDGLGLCIVAVYEMRHLIQFDLRSDGIMLAVIVDGGSEEKSRVGVML
jgi:hypothetical protein